MLSVTGTGQGLGDVYMEGVVHARGKDGSAAWPILATLN
jgi:hypothetical protein